MAGLTLLTLETHTLSRYFTVEGTVWKGAAVVIQVNLMYNVSAHVCYFDQFTNVCKPDICNQSCSVLF